MNVFQPRKEEKPVGEQEFRNSSIPMPGEPGSERFNYRFVSAAADPGKPSIDKRVDRHKDKLGYVAVMKTGDDVLMACPMELAEARRKKSGQKSADNVTMPAQLTKVNKSRVTDGGKDVATMEFGKSPLHGD